MQHPHHVDGWNQRSRHLYLQRHTQRTRLLWLLVATCIIGAALLLWTRPASAHKAELSVRTSCQVNGTWTAAWSISNSESAKVMDIDDEDVTDFAPNPTPFSGTSTDSTTHANGVASVTAHVQVDWVQHEPLDYSLTAHRPEVCEVPSTTTTVPGSPPTTDMDTQVIERTKPAVPVPAAPDFTG